MKGKLAFLLNAFAIGSLLCASKQAAISYGSTHSGTDLIVLSILASTTVLAYIQELIIFQAWLHESQHDGNAGRFR